MFLLGYLQVYVVQAISYRDYAIRIRGEDLVNAANVRAIWALCWFLFVYYFGFGKWIASKLPKAPEGWSTPMVLGVSPFLIVWGLVCSGVILSAGANDRDSISNEENLFRQFPLVLLVAGNLLVVTGNRLKNPKPMVALAGLSVPPYML